MMYSTCQEFYEELVARYKNGMLPCLIESEGKYRGLDGMSCPIGMLLPDREYRASFDDSFNGLSASDLIDVLDLPSDVPGMVDDNWDEVADALNFIQSEHDRRLDVSEINTALSTIATRLDIPVSQLTEQELKEAECRRIRPVGAG